MTAQHISLGTTHIHVKHDDGCSILPRAVTVLAYEESIRLYQLIVINTSLIINITEEQYDLLRRHL